jgi:hypothetical protein
MEQHDTHRGGEAQRTLELPHWPKYIGALALDAWLTRVAAYDASEPSVELCIQKTRASWRPDHLTVIAFSYHCISNGATRQYRTISAKDRSARTMPRLLGGCWQSASIFSPAAVHCSLYMANSTTRFMRLWRQGYVLARDYRAMPN